MIFLEVCGNVRLQLFLSCQKVQNMSIYIKRKLEKTDIADLILVDTGLVLFCEHLRMSQGFTVYQTVCSNMSPGNVSIIK